MGNTPMAPKDMLRWGRIAAKAAGHNKSSAVLYDHGEYDFPSVAIVGHVCEQVRYANGGFGFDIGDDIYESLVEALAEMLSRACFGEVEQALMAAGLKWEGEG